MENTMQILRYPKDWLSKPAGERCAEVYTIYGVKTVALRRALGWASAKKQGFEYLLPVEEMEAEKQKWIAIYNA